ncbi:MAG: hypothetical protein ACREP7_00025 [Lysobacter sp.]
MITLTLREIKDLAEYAGLVFEPHSVSGLTDEMETEFTIADAPTQGVTDDLGRTQRYAHIAWETDCPDEGCYPLGNEIEGDR